MGHECNLLSRDLQLEADLFYMENVSGQHVFSLNIQKMQMFLYMVVNSLLLKRESIKDNQLFQLSVNKMT